MNALHSPKFILEPNRIREISRVTFMAQSCHIAPLWYIFARRFKTAVRTLTQFPVNLFRNTSGAL